MPFSFGDEDVFAGDSNVVTCAVVKGDPPIVISWLFNGTEVEGKQGVNVFKAGARASSLSIDSVRAEHSGGYSCVARNAAGNSNFTAILHVNGISVV